MKIGLTYDLRQVYLEQGFSEEETAEFESQETVRGLVSTIRDLGFEPVPIGHIRDLAERLLRGERWDLVFNVAEGLRGFGREAQVPCLLDSFGIPYTFSDPLVLSLSLHKAMTKRVLRDLGIATPDFALVESKADLDQVSLPFPLFVKPVAEGTSKGITATSRVCSKEELEKSCSALFDKFNQPVLIEGFLPGREFTVGITGTGGQSQILGVMEIMLEPQAEPMAYSYSNKEHYEKLVRYQIVKDKTARRAAEIALAAWRGLGCRDGGRIDLRCDARGRVNVIELNPLPGLHPVRSDLVILARMVDISYAELIGRIIRSAQQRQPTPSPALHQHPVLPAIHNRMAPYAARPS
jgi:D-alanine-D-alanine ligase